MDHKYGNDDGSDKTPGPKYNPKWEMCPACEGEGVFIDKIVANRTLYGMMWIKCPWCNGSGAVTHDVVEQYHYMKAGHGNVFFVTKGNEYLN